MGWDYIPPAWAGTYPDPTQCICLYRDNQLLEVIPFSLKKPYLRVGQDKRSVDIFANNSTVNDRQAVFIYDTRGFLYLVDVGADAGGDAAGEHGRDKGGGDDAAERERERRAVGKDHKGGTYVNGAKVQPHKRVKLNVGDKVVFGKSTRYYLIEQDYDDTLAKMDTTKKRKVDDSTVTSDNQGSAPSKHYKTHQVPPQQPAAALAHPSNPANHAAPASQPETVRVLHLLVKHNESRNPSSWKEAKITKSKAEAESELRGYKAELEQAKLQNNLESRFRALATKHSDCKSHERGGDLGKFGRGKMQKSFEQAAFALKVGEMSDLVYSESGVHLLYRVS